MRVRRLFQKPQHIVMICFVFLSLTLVGNGTLWRLWNLHREYDRFQKEIISLQDQSQKLDLDIKKIKDPAYIERQARDRLDLVGENDLVFVFPSE